MEWLGELSCNVLFEDKHSAARAFHSMSQELPSPPPDSSAAADDPKDESMEEMKEETKDEANDDNGGEGGEERALSMDDGAAEDTSATNDVHKQQQDQEPLPDYGGVGWRFCKWTVRKVRRFDFLDILQCIFTVGSDEATLL